MGKLKVLRQLLFVAGFALPSISQASLLTGNLNFSGIMNVQISTGKIDFGVTSGPIGVTASTGDYASLAGTTGVIKNIDNPPYPVDTFFATPFFVTLAGAPNISFTLQVLLGGVDGSASCGLAPAPGQTCTPNVPSLSPFNLSNSAGGTSSASFVVTGLEVDALTSTSTPFTGIVTAQFTNPYQTLLATIASNGTVSTSYSATFTTAAPEPSSTVTAAGGALIIGLGLLFRKRFPAKA
jgi:hypothetical protein